MIEPAAETGALSFIGSRDLPPSRAVAFDVLDAQQSHVHRAFRAGFETPRRLLEWMHAAGAVSLGKIDDGWYPDVMGDYWTVAGFMTDPDLRQRLATHPPHNPESVRERHLQQHLLPAFNSAIALLRTKANEYQEHQAPDRPEGQRYLAMRPRLHQVAVSQHRALRAAVGAPGAPSLEGRTDVTDWAQSVVGVTTGAVSNDWLQRVTRPTGPWFDLLTGDGGQAVLLALLADDLLPAMNAALREAGQRGNELVEDTGGVDQSPMGYTNE